MANMMINDDPFLQERAFTKEEKKVEKTAEKRLNSAITLLIVGCRCLTNTLPQFHAVKREVENKGGHTSDHKRQLQFSTCKEAFCCQNPGAIGCWCWSASGLQWGPERIGRSGERIQPSGFHCTFLSSLFRFLGVGSFWIYAPEGSFAKNAGNDKRNMIWCSGLWCSGGLNWSRGWRGSSMRSSRKFLDVNPHLVLPPEKWWRKSNWRSVILKIVLRIS